MNRILSIAMLALLADAATSLAGTFLYVSVAGENKISAYTVDPESGHLTHQADVQTDGKPGSLTVDPSRNFLFAAVRSTGAVASFRIDSKTGKLTPLSTSVVDVDPSYVRTDATGKYLLSAYYRAGKVAVHAIDDGKISHEAIQWIETDEKAHGVVMDASNRFVYVPHTGPNAIFQFRFDATSGALSPNSPAKTITPENSGPRHGWIHPSGRFAYFDMEQGSSVMAFKLDAKTGALDGFQTISTLPTDFVSRNSCADLELTPAGDFLFVSNRGHDSIACFAVDAESGRLTLIEHEPTEKTPRSFNVDPSGRFLYAAGQGSGKLTSYQIDADTGKLTRMKTHVVGEQPWWVLVVDTDQ